jgi:serine/threonine protein kinase
MEYADSGTLRDYLEKNIGNLTWNDKFNMAYQLACAVSCLHDEGIIHRDLVIHLYFITCIIIYDFNHFIYY